MKHIARVALLLSISCTAYAQQMPEQLSRYEKIFPALEAVAKEVWTGAEVPYKDLPVLDYDLDAKTEFLINYPATPPADYIATPHIVNGKTVYKKQGALSSAFPGGQCCRNIGGIPTVTMGYPSSAGAEDILRILLHEGFHHYQQESLYKTDTDSVLTRYKRDYLRYSPDSIDYATTLVAETRILAEMTDSRVRNEGSGEKEGLGKLAALGTIRKKQLPEPVSLGEDSEFLIEGTAVYVELRGLELIIGGKPGLHISTGTLKQLYGQYADHYGPAMLRNQINLTGTARGEMTYRHALALIKLLERTAPYWHTGIFPLLPGNNTSKKQAEHGLLKHISDHSLAKMLAAAVNISPAEARALADAAIKEYLSKEDMTLIRKKQEIERKIHEFPFDSGWTYQIDAGQFLYAYFDYRTGKMYYGDTLENAYLSGLAKIESVDRRLLMTNIAIPIIADIYHGQIRFKDTGHNLDDARVSCAGKHGEICDTLEISIKGLDVKIINASVKTDHPGKITFVKLLK